MNKTINVTITRKWIKSMRKSGKSDTEIVEDTFKRIFHLEKDGPCQLADVLRNDMKLAGLIGD